MLFRSDELAAGIQGAAHTFGIGTPGAISPRTGLLKNSNTVCMNGQPLKASWSESARNCGKHASRPREGSGASGSKLGMATRTG